MPFIIIKVDKMKGVQRDWLKWGFTDDNYTNTQRAMLLGRQAEYLAQ